MAWKRLILIFATVALSATIVFAAVSWQKYSYFSNMGGLNDNISTLEIADNEATDLQNIVYDTGGAIAKRYGFNNITGSSQPFKLNANGGTAVTGVYFYKKANGNKYLVAIENVNGTARAYDKQYDASGNIPNGNWTQIDNNVLPSGYTDNNLVSFTVAEDNLVITLGSSTVQNPFVWTGTGNITTLTASPNVKPSTYAVYHKNILFIAGDPANPSRVTFSDLTNGTTTFVATDFFDLDKNNGQKITGMISAFGNLYIFENNSIWMLTGSTRDDFALQKMVDNVGTLSHQSISIVNNSMCFITSQNDVAVYDGNFGVKFLSSKIRNTIGGNNFNRAPQSIGIGFSSYRYKDLDYYVAESAVGSTQNNVSLLYDTYRQAWLKLSGINPASWTVAESATGQNILVVGDYAGNVLYYPNIGVYNDVSNSCTTGNICTVTSPSINAYYQSKWFRYSDIALGDKYLRLIKTYIQNSSGVSNTLTTQINTDYNTSGNLYLYQYTNSGAQWDVSQWDVATWPGGSLNIDREEPNLGKQMFQIRYSNNNAGEPMIILGYDLFVEPTDRI